MSTGVFSSGAVFAGRYQIVRCIATGGMGAVYEALHLETDRRRALKVMHPHFVESAELRSRFRQEARVAARIESDHIVEVFDAGIDDATGMPFLVMELLRGEELAKRLDRVQRLAPAEALLYLHQTATVLEKTHRANIVHRDLKPENLFLCERDEGLPRIKVLDFGIAKLVSEAGATGMKATRSLGTPLYMAPEQFRAGGTVSPATDIFALGMIAYTVLVGAPYWLEEGNMVDNVFAFAATAGCGPLEAATARARRQGVTLPLAFDAWFARATALAPTERFSSALASVQALAEVLGTGLPGGREPSSPHGLPAPQLASYPSLPVTPPVAPRLTPPVAPPVGPPVAPPIAPPIASPSMPVGLPPRASVPSAPQFGVPAPRFEATAPLPGPVGRGALPSASEGVIAQSAAHGTAPFSAVGPAREPQASSPMMRLSTPVDSSITSKPQPPNRTPLLVAGALGLVLLVGGGIAFATRASHKDASEADKLATGVAAARDPNSTAAPAPLAPKADTPSPPTVTPAATASPSPNAEAAAPSNASASASASATRSRSSEPPAPSHPATATATARPKTEKKSSIYKRD